MKRILIPLDLGDVSHDVLGSVRDFVAGADREIHLLHVIETLRDVSFEDLKDFYEPIEERCRTELGKLRDALAADGIEATVDLVYGNRVRQILAQARDKEIDLIVMGSHAVSDEAPASALATISYQVAALSPCSILLVK